MVAAKRILIIDDEDDIREVAQLSLEAVGGWEVATAASGIEGLEKAAAEQPDAILLDVMMPDMDGIATFKQLQANPTTGHIPVILLTAKVQSAERQRFAQLGMTAAIDKPFDPMELADRVTEILGWNC
nr:response regulator [Chroococcidiopsis sp. [FACHB-1243]]